METTSAEVTAAWEHKLRAMANEGRRDTSELRELECRIIAAVLDEATKKEIIELLDGSNPTAFREGADLEPASVGFLQRPISAPVLPLLNDPSSEV